MPFEARIFIQGTGVYVPHEDRQRVLVLFPNWQRTHDLGLRDPTDPTRPICRHHAVVQLDARNLSPSAAEAWLTYFCQGRWIGVESDSQVEMQVAMRPNDQGILGMPQIEEVATRAGLQLGEAVQQDLLDGTGDPAELLATGLYLDRGALSPSSEYQGAWRFTHRNRRIEVEDYYASVMKLELGTVNRFALRFRSFDSGGEETLELHPIGDELDVWIRHYCKVEERPKAEDETCELANPDVDFALNFALASQFEQILSELPVPVPIRSWGEGEEGGPIGGDCHRCMCGGTNGNAFAIPPVTSD